MAKASHRLSSIFSIGNPPVPEKYDRGSANHLKPLPTPKTSRTTSPIRQVYPTPSSRNPSPAKIHRPTTPTPINFSRPSSTSPTRSIRRSSSSTNLRSQRGRHSSTATTSFGPLMSPPLEVNDQLLPPPHEHSTQARSGSVGETGSRLESLAGRAFVSNPPSPTRLEHHSRPSTPTTDNRQRRRRSWMLGKGRPSSQSDDDHSHSPRAWSLGSEAPYDVSYLVDSQKAPDLWDEDGNAFVYLYPRESGRAPSFKVDSSIFAASKSLAYLAHGGDTGRGRKAMERHYNAIEDATQHLSLNAPTITPSLKSPISKYSSMPLMPSAMEEPLLTSETSISSHTMSDSSEESSNEIHLYVPTSKQIDSGAGHAQSRRNSEDVEALVAIRNLFAFLLGRSLVATSKYPTTFKTLLGIADLLERYEFSNMDSSSFGEVANSTCAQYVHNYKLADIRFSREKTIEAIILGERLRSWELYNEGFVHGVGKYDDITKLRSPKFNLISDLTRSRMERASMDLYLRLKTIRARLEDFEFPSLFAGFANSTTSDESKTIRFKSWKNSFISIRRHVIGFYKQQYGDWPPRAKSKKNDFEESGLNRMLLRELYQDFSDLYDMLVDRQSPTSRSADMPIHDGPGHALIRGEEAIPRALRQIMSEYDRSSPPVQPPVPFDIPQLLSPAPFRRDFDKLDTKKQAKERQKKLRDDDINNALMHSYNRDSVKSTPFLEDFMRFERRSAHGGSISEINDLRVGQWIFLYAVIQSLPLAVVDAPDIKWTNGVEYFLCEVPKGAAPWMKDAHGRKQIWYGVAGGAGMVSLPADVVEHGVEAVYRRSHCWKAAERWTGYHSFVEAREQPEPGIMDSPILSPLIPPPQLLSPGYTNPWVRSRSSSPVRSRRDSVQILGLEALPLPQGVSLDLPRPATSLDPTKSFNRILGIANSQDKTKRK